MLTPVKYSPGTIKSKQHTKLTSAAFIDTNGVRFQSDGRLSTIPAYSQAAIDEISGKTRAIYAQRITGSSAGDCYFFGTHSHLYVEKNNIRYNITPLVTTGVALTTDPFALVNGDATMTVTYTAHGLAVDDRIKFSGATHGTVGFATANINIEHIVATVINANVFTVELPANAPATDATEGGASVLIYKQIVAGIESQVAAAGMGGGHYGAGLFGAGASSATGLLSYPRIWSFGAFGDDVVMCPGDRTAGDGQKIYIWDGDTAVAPTVLTNAPTDCNWVAVVNNSIVALCGRTIKISALGAGTTWSGLLYRAKTFERIDVAHSAFNHGEKNAIIHHGNGVILLRYIGGADIWDLSDLFTDDGVASPYSTARLADVLYWRGSRGFYSYDGGIVKQLNNPQNMDWIINNVNNTKDWHSFAATDTENQEIYFHFPTGSEDEPSDYVILSQDGSFTLGRMDRTAAQRPGIFSNTFYMADGEDIYRHFTRGAVTFDWYAETAFAAVEGGEQRIFLNEFRPDSTQSGNITLEIISREYAQSADVSHGTWTITPTTELISPKAAGRFIKLKFSGSTAAVLGLWSYNIKALGKRIGAV